MNQHAKFVTVLGLSTVFVGTAPFAFGDIAQQGGPNAGVQAQGSTASTAAYNKNQDQDAMILSKIHHVDQAEINAGQLAQSNSQSAAVKQYGQMLVQDHTQADAKVTQLASTLGITLTDPQPKTDEEKKMMDKHEADMASLKTLSGPAFDAKFSDMMAKGHHHVIGDLEKKEAQLPANDQVRQLIVQLLPQLKQHEAGAKQLMGAKA